MLESSGQGAEDLSEDAEAAGASVPVAAALACLDCLLHADPWKEADLAEQDCIPHTIHLCPSALVFLGQSCEVRGTHDAYFTRALDFLGQSCVV